MNILGTVNMNMKKPQWEKSRIIGKNIATLRKSLEITQEDLAEQLGVSRRASCSYGCGKASVPLALIPEISELLKTPLVQLMDATTPMIDERTKDAKILQELEKIKQLSNKEQKTVFTLINSMTAHA